jgi:predicted SAM-dependent methyltransferase
VQEIRINIGSGTTLPSGWINIDNSWHARICKIPALKSTLLALRLLPAHYRQIKWARNVCIHDITDNLPFGNSTVTVIYASHIVEHLFLDQAQQLFIEAYRVLKSGGIFRVIVPDLDALIRNYQERRQQNDDMALANQRFVKSLLMVEYHEQPIPFWIRWFRGHHDKNLHRWIYNEEQLKLMFKQAGFESVSRQACYESKIDHIREIEQPDRLHEAICLEAIKQ